MDATWLSDMFWPLLTVNQWFSIYFAVAIVLFFAALWLLRYEDGDSQIGGAILIGSITPGLILLVLQVMMWVLSIIITPWIP